MRRLLRWLFFGSIALILGSGTIALFGYFKLKEYEKDLPSLDPILHYRPRLSTRLYANDETLLGEFYFEKRILKTIDEVPRKLQLAIIAAEDKNFYQHRGLDYWAILRAALANHRAGRVVQGGSTITQQVVKMLAVGNERNLDRKIKEALLARRLETLLSKDKILEIYLNQVYLGHGAYGVAAAAEVYFEKALAELTLGEISMIAGLTKSPAHDSPYHNLFRARTRQEYVVSRMIEDGYLNAKEAPEAMAFNLSIARGPININERYAPHFVEFIRRELKGLYGDQLLYGGGLSVHTTLDINIQRIAEEKVKQATVDLNKKFSWIGPVGDNNLTTLAWCQPSFGLPQKLRKKLSPFLPGWKGLGVVVSLEPSVVVCVKRRLFTFSPEESTKIKNWLAGEGENRRRVARGDLLSLELALDTTNPFQTSKNLVPHLAKTAPIDAAALVIDEFGQIKAMVGGSDFSRSEWNRVVQAKRQAGSAIKPFIYSKAIENGYTEMSKVADSPVAVKTVAGLWQPKNYKKEYLGPITLRTALTKSINTVSVRLVQDIGLDPTIEMLMRFGLNTKIPRHISIALGTPDVTLLDMSYAYSAFANDGYIDGPIYIKRVVDNQNQPIYHQKIRNQKVLDFDVAYVMVDLMKSVMQNGTGRKAKFFPLTEDQWKKMGKTERVKYKARPVAGKTGTSTDFRDAWFIGYTNNLLCGIWVGRDDFMPIGHDATGGRVALPIWLEIMSEAHPQTEFRDFPVPSGITFKYMDQATGRELKKGAPGGVMIPFRELDFDHLEVQDENFK